jgi:hypothetical protein
VVIGEWLADYQRAGETGTFEAQLDILWPTTGTPNSTEVTEDRCFRMIGSQSVIRANHHGRLRPGDDAGQAQSPGESGRDVAGHREEVELKAYYVPGVSPAKKWGFQKVFCFVGVPDGI